MCIRDRLSYCLIKGTSGNGEFFSWARFQKIFVDSLGSKPVLMATQGGLNLWVLGCGDIRWMTPFLCFFWLAFQEGVAIHIIDQITKTVVLTRSSELDTSDIIHSVLFHPSKDAFNTDSYSAHSSIKLFICFAQQVITMGFSHYHENRRQSPTSIKNALKEVPFRSSP